jgi:hypothetical protein
MVWLCYVCLGSLFSGLLDVLFGISLMHAPMDMKVHDMQVVIANSSILVAIALIDRRKSIKKNASRRYQRARPKVR